MTSHRTHASLPAHSALAQFTLECPHCGGTQAVAFDEASEGREVFCDECGYSSFMQRQPHVAAGDSALWVLARPEIESEERDARYGKPSRPFPRQRG